MDLKLLQEYMLALITLSELHGKAFEGRNLVIPACFSEAVCRYLLHLQKPSSKDIDAIDSAGCTYEIKATSTKSGTTSIRKNQKATYLIWVNFDFETRGVTIRKTNYEAVKVMVEKDKTANDRANISLNKITTWENMLICKMDNLFLENT